MSNPDDALRHKLADFVTEEDSGEGNIVEDIIA